jgi:hypothetical protein
MRTTFVDSAPALSHLHTRGCLDCGGPAIECIEDEPLRDSDGEWNLCEAQWARADLAADPRDLFWDARGEGPSGD